MITEKDILDICKHADASEANLELVVEVADAADYAMLVRTAMEAFGRDHRLDRAGVLMPDGKIRVIERDALYHLASSSSKSVGDAGGAQLPGLPNYHVTTFACPVDGCRQRRTWVGHRPGASLPECPVHNQPMVCVS